MSKAVTPSTPKGAAKPATPAKPVVKSVAKPGSAPTDAVAGAAAGAVTNAVPAHAVKGGAATLGQSFGEMVWLMTQSPIHKMLKLGDLEWLLMPSILLGQARVFKAGDQAIALALWAYLTPAEATELGKKGRLAADGWRHGTNVMDVVAKQKAGEAVDLTPPALKEGELELWLVDLVCPFATPENKLVQVCLADLVQGPLKGMKLKMHKTDPTNGEKTVIEVGGE